MRAVKISLLLGAVEIVLLFGAVEITPILGAVELAPQLSDCGETLGLWLNSFLHLF